MEYTVQRGDTIAKVTSMLGTDWHTLKKLNPDAVGQLKRNGNWFLKEGRTVAAPRSFTEELEHQSKQISQVQQQDRKQQFPGTKEMLHTVKPGDTVWALAVKRYHVDPKDILRLNNISDPTKLKPGMQLRIPRPQKGGAVDVVASWYGEYHHGRPMANGDPYDMFGETIAHKQIPLGTRVELSNPETGQTARAVVTDRGPYVDGRDVDLSFQLAQRLSLVEQGVGKLVMRVL